MSEHIGGKSIGGHPIQTGEVKALFDGITIDGECHGLDLVLGGNLIAQGGAPLNAKNPSGASKTARGSDDVDAVLDFVYGNGATLKVDETTLLFQAELLSRVRSILSGVTARDVEVTGALVDGTAINASGGATKAFTLRLPLQLSMRDELLKLDGDAYKQGTERVKKGGFFAKVAAIAGNIAFQNGGVVLSGLTVDIQAHIDRAGDKYYCGPTWRIESDSNLLSEVKDNVLRRAKRLFVMVDRSDRGPYTVKVGGEGKDLETDSRDVASFNSAFNRNRRVKGGDNTAARGVVLVFPRDNLTLAEMDLVPSKLYVKDTSGQAVDTLISFIHEPLNETIAARLKGQAVIDNKGREVQTSTPTPPSAQGHNQVHTGNASILGRHVAPVRK